MYFFTLTVIADTKTIDQFDRGGFTDSNAKKKGIEKDQVQHKL